MDNPGPRIPPNQAALAALAAQKEKEKKEKVKSVPPSMKALVKSLFQLEQSADGVAKLQTSVKILILE